MKKIFAVVLALLMFILSANVTAFAAETEIEVDASELLPLDAVTQLPYGAVNSVGVTATVPLFENEDDYLLYSYTTDAAGAYCLNFTNLHAFVSVVNDTTDEWVYEEVDTEYVALDNQDWQMRDRLVFQLDAHTTYYFLIFGYESTTTKLSITKDTLGIVDIVLEVPRYETNSTLTFDRIDGDFFGYRITFADNTSGLYRYAAIEKAGYIVEPPVYVGDTFTMHDEEYLAPGKQPVQWTYNGVTTTIYLQVTSFDEWLTDKGVTTAMGENSKGAITYEGEGTYTYYWRIKMSRSGYFGVFREETDAFGTNFDYYSIEVVDKNNCVISFDQNKGAWPLIEGEEYVLSFRYEYNQNHTTNKIEFWFQKDADMPANKWMKVGSRWYKFENSKLIKNAWRKDSKGWVYLGADGAMYVNRWAKDSKGWCYLGADGYAVTNCWKKDSHGWIWLDANGSMTKSKWIRDNGKWYYLDKNGYMVANKWQKDSKGWCYLGADGAMRTNCWQKDSKGWCYLGADGYAVTKCWKQDSHGWIYLDANGSMTKSKWVQSAGKWYYCDANGYMVANKTINIGGKRYTFNASGVWVG